MPSADILLTALAPIIWGSTYWVTTEILPPGYPLTVAMLRALPAGLLLLLLVRRLPRGIWWLKAGVLGALNFSVFWWLLFVAAYRLPGGVAATVGAVQPLIVLVLARLALGTPIPALGIAAAIAGIAGVGLLILTPAAALDTIGIAAGLAAALSMAAGTVLTRRWHQSLGPTSLPATALTVTAWQMTAGGLLLLPFALLIEPPLPALDLPPLLGLLYLGVIGGAATYWLWFRGLTRLGPNRVAPLGFLSPVSAVIIGWLALGQALTAWQMLGMALVLGGVWFSQRAHRPR